MAVERRTDICGGLTPVLQTLLATKETLHQTTRRARQTPRQTICPESLQDMNWRRVRRVYREFLHPQGSRQNIG
jgi:hypothetical protein